MAASRPDYVPGHIPDPKYVRVLDTTLRDGEQSPGAAMTPSEKLDIALQLARLGVDIIEAGFPASSDADFDAVRSIADEVGAGAGGHVPVVCAVARCNERDIATAWKAVKGATRPRVSTFIATSDIHMKYKLKMSPEQVVDKATKMVAFARSLGCNDVSFCPEDAGRSEKEFLYRILGEVIRAGATTIIIADTVGSSLPTQFGKLIGDIKANTLGIDNVILATHCHNDLGLATANTLAGIEAGARQVEVTINGIGERAGNASLEEVVMALKCCGEQFIDGLYTGINTKHLIKASNMVEEYSGMAVQPHKAIVGANAFAHQSGIHQDGMLKHKSTYEFMSPEDIGLIRSNESGLVLGKLSGRHAVKVKMLELGFDIDGKELSDVFARFKTVAAAKKVMTHDDLIALVSDQTFQSRVVWKLLDIQVTCGSLGFSTAAVKLSGANGDEHIASSVGNGAVDAAFKAVDLVVKVPVRLLDYSVNATVTERTDTVVTTSVLIRSDDDTNASGNGTFSGRGEATDIVISSIRAYIGALNKMLGFSTRSETVATNGTRH